MHDRLGRIDVIQPERMAHFVGEHQKQVVCIVKLEDIDGLPIELPFVKRGLDAVEGVVGVGIAVIGGDEVVALGL